MNAVAEAARIRAGAERLSVPTDGEDRPLRVSGGRKTKRIILPLCVVLALLTLGYSFYEARSEEAASKPPQAVWAKCRRLESQIQAADDEIRQLENETRRVQEAIANYEFVRKQNAGTLERLRRWADAE